MQATPRSRSANGTYLPYGRRSTLHPPPIAITLPFIQPFAFIEDSPMSLADSAYRQVIPVTMMGEARDGYYSVILCNSIAK